MTRNFKYYAKIWWLLTKSSLLAIAGQKIAVVFFLTGKIFRFAFFILFLYFLINGTGGLAGYTSNQAIFFFLTFNIVDVVSQFLFREVYRFRPKIVSGDFDLSLVKPVNPLFVSLMGGADIIDLITIPPLFLSVIYIAAQFQPTILQIFLFILLTFNSLLIAAAFHIAVLSMAIITLEIDHTIMIYRDLTSFGRFPVDVYKEPLKGVLTYLIPVGIMMTIPAKAFIGGLNFSVIIISFAVAFASIYFADRFWNFALKKYTSASS